MCTHIFIICLIVYCKTYYCNFLNKYLIFQMIRSFFTTDFFTEKYKSILHFHKSSDTNIVQTLKCLQGRQTVDVLCEDLIISGLR